MSPLFMTILLLVGWGVFAYSARRRWNLMMVGTAEKRSDNIGQRLWRTLFYGFGQWRMKRYPLAGTAHIMIFAGFAILLQRTLILWGRGFDESFNLWILGPETTMGKMYSIQKDIFVVLVLIGTMVFAYLRVVKRLSRMTLGTEGLVILGIIFVMMVGDVFYDGALVALDARTTEVVEQGYSTAGTPVPVKQKKSYGSLGQFETKKTGYAPEPDSPIKGVKQGLGTPLAAMEISTPPVLGSEDEKIELDLKASGWNYTEGKEVSLGDYEQVIIKPVEFLIWEPAGTLAAMTIQGLSDDTLIFIKHAGFWIHSMLVLVFLNLLPHSKHFHVITAIPNIFVQDLHSPGRLPPILDIDGKLEREETLGIKKINQFSWKSIMDFYTCTECGRCSDQCPATKTGKKLSPKHFTLDLRNFLYKHDDALVAAKANGNGAPAEEGDTPEYDKDLIDGVIDPEVLWACTSCRACETECPVFITYVDKIVDMRRYLVQERGEFPNELQTAFRGLESSANPWGFPAEERENWASDLNIKRLAEHPEVPVLFWVGCAPAFDERAKKVTRATAKLMKQAGVDFAILGNEEQCTGDPARRAGNEYLFQMFATANVEVLNGYEAGKKKIITSCPHCFNTLLNEYPDFGGKFDVVHHTTFLAELVKEGKLKPTKRIEKKVAYHDSCYLGRHNEVYDPPREVLSSIPGLTVLEPKETRDRGMCCGAGGAQMFKEEESGDERINEVRTQQMLDTKPDCVSSACPFCMRMLTDGLATKDREDVEQLDIAEMLLESVGEEASPS